MKCNVCPRNCNVERSLSSGFCQTGEKMVISKVMLHYFEEPILTGGENKPSGAIFFAGCNLKCVYCQNYEISHGSKGKEVTKEEFIEIIKKLESMGAENIDLVTPTHYASQIAEALKIYKPSVPVIWNTGGYEKAETIAKLKGLVDVYLTDFKYADDNLAIKYSSAPDYVKNAKNALFEMKKQQNDNIFENNKLVRGIVIRHLVLPNNAKDSNKVLDIVKDICGGDAIISIMAQYTPMAKKLPQELNRKITPLEYKTVVNHALKLGLNNSLTQDLSSASSCYTPNFKEKIIEI